MLRGLCCLCVLHSTPSKLWMVWTAQSPEHGSCNAGLTSANATKWEIRYGDYCFSQHDLALIGILDRWTCVHEYLQNSDYMHKQGVKSDMWAGAENHIRNKLTLRQRSLHVDHLSVTVANAAENSTSICVQSTTKTKTFGCIWSLLSADNMYLHRVSVSKVIDC